VLHLPHIGIWEGGNSACNHIEPQGGTGEASWKQETNKGTRQIQYKDICRKCGAKRIDNQLGLEKTPMEYVEKIINVMREVKRVLKKDGILWLNLGDNHYGAGGKGHTPKDPNAKQLTVRGSTEETILRRKGFPSKNLVGIPWMVAFALRDDGWYLRADVIWDKFNCMPESVRDRPTISHEYMFLLSKSKKYYYDYKAIKEPYTKPMNRWGGQQLTAKNKSNWDENTKQQTYRNRNMRPDPKGKNKRSVWHIATQSYKGAHFAVFPEKLVEPCILAGCPVGGIVMDPFAGSGTTLAVAKKLGRKGIGIDLKPTYCDLEVDRVLKVTLNMPIADEVNVVMNLVEY
jgi:DNA modification methylase